jgi:hypothetical protein
LTIDDEGETGDEAIKLFDSSPRASSSESGYLRRHDKPDMGAPIPWQQFVGGLCSRASEHIGELGLRIYITQLGSQTLCKVF